MKKIRKFALRFGVIFACTFLFICCTPVYAASSWLEWFGGPITEVLNAVVVEGNAIYIAGQTFDDNWQEVIWDIDYSSAQRDVFVVKLNYDGVNPPSVAWSIVMGGDATDIATSLAVVGNEIFVAGYCQMSNWTAPISWTGTPGASWTTASSDGFLIKITESLTTAEPSVTWGQWLGTMGNYDRINDVATVDGDEIYVAGSAAAPEYISSTYPNNWGAGEDVPFYGSFVNTGSCEGFLIEVKDDGASPTLVWGEYLGGDSLDWARKIAISDVDHNIIYVAGTSRSTDWNDWVVASGTVTKEYFAVTDAFVAKVTDNDITNTPEVIWAQWLGGRWSEGLTGLGVDGDEVFAGGWSEQNSWEEITPLGTFTDRPGRDPDYGNNQCYIVKITDDGNSNTLNWGKWLGYSGPDSSSYCEDTMQNLIVDGSKIYAAGWTNSAAWDDGITFGNSYNNADAFLVELTDGAAGPTYNGGMYIGGSDTDRVNSIALYGSEIILGGSTWGDAPGWAAMFTDVDGTFSGTLGESFVCTTPIIGLNEGEGSSLLLAPIF